MEEKDFIYDNKVFEFYDNEYSHLTDTSIYQGVIDKAEKHISYDKTEMLKILETMNTKIDDINFNSQFIRVIKMVRLLNEGIKFKLIDDGSWLKYCIAFMPNYEPYNVIGRHLSEGLSRFRRYSNEEFIYEANINSKIVFINIRNIILDNMAFYNSYLKEKMKEGN